MKLVVGYIVLALVATGVLYAMVQTRSSVHMEITDRAEKRLNSGERAVYICVKASEIDSTMCRQYANNIFHREVSDTQSVQEPIQMNFFFYRESNLRDLSQEELLGMAGPDITMISRLRKLTVDSTGYGVVRFSDVYTLFGRDSLYGFGGKVIIPGHGSQMRDFLKPPTQSKQ